MTVTAQKSQFQKHIAGLRAVAIALVILAHYSVVGFGGGFIGVDIFFVISGFLITGVLTREYENSRDVRSRKGSISLKNFYLRRIRRLLPAAAVVSLATITWTYFNFSSFRFKSTLVDFMWAQVFAANLNFSVQDSNYFLRGSGVSVFRHFWSLSVEEQFYFLWPALLMLAISLQALKIGGKKVSWQVRALAMLIVVSVISFAAMLVLFVVFPIGAYYLLSSRAWELGLGGIAALGLNHFKVGSRLRELPSWVADLSFLAILASVFLVNNENFGWALLIPVVSSAIFIAIGGVCGGFATALLSTKPLQFTGKISYSLYLWHWPILVLAQQGGYLTDWQSYAIAVVITIAVATASYFIIEKPFLAMKIENQGRNLLPLVRENRGRFVAVGSALMLTVALVPTLGVMPAASDFRNSVGNLFTKSQGAVSLPVAVPSATNSSGPQSSPASTSAEVDSLKVMLDSRHQQITRSIAASYKGVAPSAAAQQNIANAINQATFTDTTGWQCKIIQALQDCQIGPATAKKSWLVLGDSMAQQYQSALRRISEANRDISIRVIHQGQCPNSITLQGLDSRTNVTDPKVNTDCIATHRYESKVLNSHRFDLVMLSDFGGNFPRYGAEAATYAKSVMRQANHVIIISRNPDYPDLSVCLNRDLTNLNNCAGVASADTSDMQVANAVGAGLISPNDFLCYLGKCPALIDEYPVTSHDHISASQSYFSGSIFGAMIRNLAPSAF